MTGCDAGALSGLRVEASGRVAPVLASVGDWKHGRCRLPDHARYILSGGGKRVRPFLALSACSALGGDPSRAVHAAAAVEMVHAYSLVHDDLPAMDDDATRRGRPTLHVLHGPAHALLAGDFLLTAAFLELARTPVPPSLLSQMLDRLAEASGGGSLVGGQYMDMNPPPDPDRAWIERMVGGKTSAMIRVSLELGALCAGGSDALERLSPAGEALGMLFQVTDDLLDATGDPGSLGKAAGKDAERGKANLVTLAGVEEARLAARRLAGDVDRMFAGSRGDWGPVRLLAACLPDRRS